LDYDQVIDLDRFIYQPTIFSGQRIRPVSMTFTLGRLLDTLSRNVEESSAPALEITELLDEAFHCPQIPFQPYQRFGTAYQLFACLALIAKRFKSTQIRGILVSFFNKYGSKIARRENETALLDWARAIVYSNMLERDIIGCLRQILLERPDFGDAVAMIARRRGSESAVTVYNAVMEILPRMGTGRLNLIERGRGYLRRGALGQRRFGTSPHRLRARRPGFGRVQSDSRLLRGGYSGIPSRSLARQDKRKIHQLEHRLAQVEDGVQALEEDNVMRNAAELQFDGASDWDDSDYEDAY
jgi:hypothetical protein